MSARSARNSTSSTSWKGACARPGNRIRVTAQLVSAADGSHHWSERYDREMTDVFAIQDEICQAIVDKLRVRAGGRPGRWSSATRRTWKPTTCT